MTVHVDFYRNKHFGGAVDPFTSKGRYHGVIFGSKFRNRISSLRAHASGNSGQVYAFTEDNFLGPYVSCNLGNGGTSAWDSLGGLNNDIESAVMINRGKNEVTLGLKEQMAPDFAAAMDKKLANTPVSRKGDPLVYTRFWPGYSPDKVFVSLQQGLHVEVPGILPDYQAEVRYDIYLYLNKNGKVRGYVAWVYVWVEGGILSHKIHDALQPQLVAGASELNSKLQAKLAVFQGFTFTSLYLLPGPPPLSPSKALGEMHNSSDDSTLVLAPNPLA
jgi:hypothetical protein